MQNHLSWFFSHGLVFVTQIEVGLNRLPALQERRTDSLCAFLEDKNRERMAILFPPQGKDASVLHKRWLTPYSVDQNKRSVDSPYPISSSSSSLNPAYRFGSSAWGGPPRSISSSSSTCWSNCSAVIFAPSSKNHAT